MFQMETALKATRRLVWPISTESRKFCWRFYGLKAFHRKSADDRRDRERKRNLQTTTGNRARVAPDTTHRTRSALTVQVLLDHYSDRMKPPDELITALPVFGERFVLGLVNSEFNRLHEDKQNFKAELQANPDAAGQLFSNLFNFHARSPTTTAA